MADGIGIHEIRRRWRRHAQLAAATAGFIAGGVALGTLGAAYYVARQVTRPERPSLQDGYVMTPFETGADYEDVAFAPQRGHHMVEGWWLSRPETRRVIVACTGYRGSKSMLIGIGTALWRAGYNVLLFDYHGHGTGRGAPVTLGYREMQDFYGALNYVHKRVEDAQIGVIGYSMGASIAIIGSAKRQEVRAVVADSPFATHLDVVAHNVSRVLHVSGRPIALVADYFLPPIAGYRGRDVEPVREVAAFAPRPILVIHGTADTTIPFAHGKQVYEAARQPKELWIGEGAEHCGTYFLDRPGYCARVAAFFQRAFDSEVGPAETPISAVSQQGSGGDGAARRD
ncbi:MAG: alpha/beta hydrolase [Ktedonobacterales bacterium]